MNRDIQNLHICKSAGISTSRIFSWRAANTYFHYVDAPSQGMILINCQKHEFFLNKREEKPYFKG
jgi:hypothetical protein